MSEKIKEIPYGVSDYATIRERNKYYVDKTMFIPEIEKNDFNFFYTTTKIWKKFIGFYAYFLLQY